jgi:hypothetical protein
MAQWSVVHREEMGRHRTNGYDGDTVSTKHANGERAVARTSGKLLLTYGSSEDPGSILYILYTSYEEQSPYTVGATSKCTRIAGTYMRTLYVCKEDKPSTI